jgi:hypothetical protein
MGLHTGHAMDLAGGRVQLGAGKHGCRAVCQRTNALNGL